MFFYLSGPPNIDCLWPHRFLTIAIDQVLGYVLNISRAKVTRWGGMISTPNSDLIAAIRRTLVDTGCPDVSGLGGSNSNPRAGASANSNRYKQISLGLIFPLILRYATHLSQTTFIFHILTRNLLTFFIYGKQRCFISDIEKTSS